MEKAFGLENWEQKKKLGVDWKEKRKNKKKKKKYIEMLKGKTKGIKIIEIFSRLKLQLIQLSQTNALPKIKT